MSGRAGIPAVVAVLATLASCAAAPVAAPPVPAGAVPILFVHGHGADPSVFDDMIEHLEARGYPADHLLAVELAPNDGANVPAAERELAPAVEELVARTGGGADGRVDIVAHSMGALSSRWYATRVRPDRVRSLITVGGANHGSDDLCGYADPGGQELCPAFAAGAPGGGPAGGDVQIMLNGTPVAPVDETPFGRGTDRPQIRSVPPDGAREIRYLAITIPGDEWITPLASSELDGADDAGPLPAGVGAEQFRPGNVRLARPVGHDAVLQDRQFFPLLDALLDGGSG